MPGILLELANHEFKGTLTPKTVKCISKKLTKRYRLDKVPKLTPEQQHTTDRTFGWAVHTVCPSCKFRRMASS